MDINAICTVERGRAIDPAKAKENTDTLNVLVEMRAVQSMAQVVGELNNGIGGLVFTDETSRIFIDLARSTTETDPFEKRLKVLNDMIAEISRRNKMDVLKEDVSNLNVAINKIQEAKQRYQALRGQLSQATQNLEFALSRDNTRLRGLALAYLPSLRDLLVQLNSRLPVNNRLNRETISIDGINSKITSICGAISVAETRSEVRPAPTRSAPLPKPGSVGTNYRLVFGGGYVTSEAGGLAAIGGGSWQFIRSDAWRTQLDYRGGLVLAPGFTESRSGEDSLRGTAQLRSAGLTAHLQVSGERFRATTLDENSRRLLPSMVGFGQNGRATLPLLKTVALNFGDSFFIGQSGGEPQTVVFGDAGLSLHLSEQINIFAGGLAGSDRQLGGFGAGGYAGLAWLSEQLDAAARFDYDSQRGSQARAAAFVGGDLAAGPSFRLISRENHQQINAGLQGRIKFGQIYLQSEIGGSRIKDEAGSITPISALV
ncbi:MAG: hypothetical protein KKD13_02865, partial [Candidatus Margulisbacteria bacterium]|nr:hypothetical protein [Candidatus Margulisiibacteriota bacterium]